MLLQLLPSLVDCHCTVGAGLPDAAAVKLAVCPAMTVCAEGCSVISGAVFTVSRALLVTAVPALLVNTARNCLPLSPAWAVKVWVVKVAPVMLPQLVPSLLDCHCTVGAGLPEAAAVKLTACPAETVWAEG